MYIKKIVIADDESTQRDVLYSIVSKYLPGVTVFPCVNGSEALEKLTSENIDLLITDIRMPVMDGITLIRSSASFIGKPVIVLISAYADFEYARSALTAGASDYLLKPYTLSAIHTMLDKAEETLRNRSAQREIESDYRNLQQEADLIREEKALAACLYGDTQAPLSDSLRDTLCGTPGLAVIFRWKTRESLENVQPGSLTLHEAQHRFSGKIWNIRPPNIFQSEFSVPFRLPRDWTAMKTRKSFFSEIPLKPNAAAGFRHSAGRPFGRISSFTQGYLQKKTISLRKAMPLSRRLRTCSPSLFSPPESRDFPCVPK